MTLGTKGKDTREVRLEAIRKVTSLSMEPTRNWGRAVLEEEFPGLRHLQEKQRRETGGLQRPGEEASESLMASRQQFGRTHGNACHESSKEEWGGCQPPSPQA